MKQPGIKPYLEQIERAVVSLMRRPVTATADRSSPGVGHRTIHVKVEANEYDGITFTQLMALRDIFQAEFNVTFEASDGETSGSGTWWPGERLMIFTYTCTNLGS